jgi:hypothetical protein
VTETQRISTAVRDAALGVPGVAALTGGPGVEVATRFPGGKVSGVRLGAEVEVHVVLDRLPVEPVAERVRRAVRAAARAAGAPDRPVRVVVDDLEPVALARVTAGA